MANQTTTATAAPVSATGKIGVGLVRVLAKWLHSHCPTAKTILATCLLSATLNGSVGTASGGDTRSTNAQAAIRIRIETAAGIPLCTVEVPSSLNTTVADVSKLVAQQKVADDPAFAASNQILFRQGSEQRLNPNSALQEVGIVESCTLVVMFFTNRWSHEKSNDALEFSDDGREITRPGSKSSYPCGRTRNLLHKPGDFFQVRIKAIPPVHNALTIGILAKGFTFANASGRGVGAAVGSMGVHINNVHTRVKTHAGQLLSVVSVAAPGDRRNDLGERIRMFEPGDRLHFQIRCTEAQLFLDIRLNGDLFCEEPIPSSFQFPFQPLCTLPDNCCLVLEF
eukprot:INCI4360.1.p1 GENE.INCI4360.1~~INCI4360.1.p1  ORF type:complete len:339 (+),score=51.68 INCI4360.1:83-1099(+)